MILQCASALGFVHLKGIIHRDIKSGNILIARNPRGELSFKIADFGISIFEKEASEYKNESSGTPGYMAPEIRSIGQCQYSRLSDVYAFAVTVNEVMKEEMSAGEDIPNIFEPIDFDGRNIHEFVKHGLTEDLINRDQIISITYKVTDKSYFTVIGKYLSTKIDVPTSNSPRNQERSLLPGSV